MGVGDGCRSRWEASKMRQRKWISVLYIEVNIFDHSCIYKKRLRRSRLDGQTDRIVRLIYS